MPSGSKKFRMMPMAVKLCRLAGLWDDTDSSQIRTPALITIACLALWYVLPGIGFILNRDRPIAPLMKALIEVVAMSSFCVRIGLHLRQRATLKKCYGEVYALFNEYVNSMEEAVQEMLEHLQGPTERMTILYFCAAMTGVPMYGGVAGLIAIYKTIVGLERDLPATYMEADFVWFDHRSNFWIWLPIFLASLVVFSRLAITCIGQEVFCWNLIHHVSFLLKIVQLEVTLLDEYQNTLMFKSRMTTIVRIHNGCFDNIQRLEKALNMTLLLLYGLCVFNSCFGMVIIAIVDDVIILVMIGFVLCYLIFLIFSFSMLGTQLTSASLAISDAVYNLRWYERTIGEQRCLLFMLMRSQKMSGLTVGKFTFVNRVSFARALKTAFSYFTIMHQLYGN